MKGLFTLNIQPVTIGSQTRRLPPSLNARLHWAQRARWNKAFKDELYWQLKSLNIGKHKKIKVEVINYATHLLDEDNLAASLKAIFDTLVLAGIIPDDNEKHLDWECWNEKVRHRKEERVELRIKI